MVYRVKLTWESYGGYQKGVTIEDRYTTAGPPSDALLTALCDARFQHNAPATPPEDIEMELMG